jgi:hypothetical protein
MICYLIFLEGGEDTFIEFDSRPNVGDRIWFEGIPEYEFFSEKMKERINEADSFVISDIVWGKSHGVDFPHIKNKPYWILQGNFDDINAV